MPTTETTPKSWEAVVSGVIASRLRQQAERALASIACDEFELTLLSPSHYDDPSLARLVGKLRFFFQGLPGVQSCEPVMMSPLDVRVFSSDHLKRKGVSARLVMVGSSRRSIFGVDWLESAWKDNHGSNDPPGSLLAVLRGLAADTANIALDDAQKIETTARLPPSCTWPLDLSDDTAEDRPALFIVRSVLASYGLSLGPRSLSVLPMTGCPMLWLIRSEDGHCVWPQWRRRDVYIDQEMLDVGVQAAQESAPA
jgi:hypothetical protein